LVEVLRKGTPMLRANVNVQLAHFKGGGRVHLDAATRDVGGGLAAARFHESVTAGGGCRPQSIETCLEVGYEVCPCLLGDDEELVSPANVHDRHELSILPNYLLSFGRSFLAVECCKRCKRIAERPNGRTDLLQLLEQFGV
jgi:hypothetical protein